MSSQFDWDSFSSFSEKSDSPSTGDFFDQFSTLPSQQGGGIGEGIVEGVKGLGRATARSGASLAAGPIKGIGGILEFVSQFGTEGEPGQIKGMGTRFLSGLGKYLQRTGKEGQEFLKGKIEEVLGTPYSSFEESISRFGERVGDIYGRGPFKGMGGFSVAGGAGGQIAEELGASEPIQAIVELLSGGGKDIAKGVTSLLPKAIQEKSGLVLPRIVEKAKGAIRFLKPKSFAGNQEKVYENVSNQASKLINEIKSEAFPLSNQIEEGIDVSERLSKQLSDVEKIAAKMPNEIESKFLSDYLQKTRNRILESPVPTIEQEKILGLIDKFENKFGELPGGVRFYKPREYVKQYRNINKDAEKLYETQLLEGKQLETIGFYEGLKNEIVNTFETGTPESFSNLFKETNKAYSELANLNKFENVMANVTKEGVLDSSKLSSIFKSPKKNRMLRRQLGEEQFQKLRDISTDLSKVKDKLKLVDNFGLKDVIKSGATYGVLKMLGIPLAKPLQLAKKGTELLYGKYLLSPKGSRDVKNFLKAIQSGSEKSIKTYLRRLDKSVSESVDTEDESQTA